MDKQQAVAYFAADRYATETTGITIEEVGEGWAKCSLAIRPELLNQMGNVMGGAIFTLADFCAAVASNTGHMNSVAMNGTINYLAVPKGKILFAEAKTVKAGRTISVFQSEVYDDTGRHVATAMFNDFNTPKDGGSAT